MDQSQYQRIRLWSGITSIGANLALIWGLAISSAWWASGWSGPFFTSVALLASALVLTASNLPFDLLTGDALERASGRVKSSTSSWLRDWVKGRTVTLLGLWVGMVFFSLLRQVPPQFSYLPLVAAGIFIIALLLVVPAGRLPAPGSFEEKFQSDLALELEHLAKPRPIRWFNHGDLETVNGCITPRGILSLSTTVAKWLTPREAALLAAREEFYRKSGAWIVILLIVIVWTLFGVWLAGFTPINNPVQAGLLGAAVMSSWCFSALFIWPNINRIWMKKADCHLTTVAPPEEVRALIAKVSGLNATDISLSPGKTTVFHPIPPLQERLDQIS